MKTVKVKDLPFTEAVIDDIKKTDKYTTFTVVSQNNYGEQFKILTPKNDEWVNSDAYTRNQPLAVTVERYTGNGKNSHITYGKLKLNYEKDNK